MVKGCIPLQFTLLHRLRTVKLEKKKKNDTLANTALSVPDPELDFQSERVLTIYFLLPVIFNNQK